MKTIGMHLMLNSYTPCVITTYMAVMTTIYMMMNGHNKWATLATAILLVLIGSGTSMMLVLRRTVPENNDKKAADVVTERQTTKAPRAE